MAPMARRVDRVGGDGTRDTLEVGEVRIELRVGDIVAQADLDAVVNAANPQLAPGGGVAGAIHAAAGPGLWEECRPLGPVETGGCVLTAAHDLPNAAVLHCVGPVHGRDEPAAELLASCYRRALELATEAGLTSVGFPAISTGIYGYPQAAAAEVALRTVRDLAVGGLGSVRLVRFVLYDEAARRTHLAVLDRLRQGG
jgi:O-acetyl-ADP-ribose deacetylase